MACSSVSDCVLNMCETFGSVPTAPGEVSHYSLATSHPPQHLYKSTEDVQAMSLLKCTDFGWKRPEQNIVTKAAGLATVEAPSNSRVE